MKIYTLLETDTDTAGPNVAVYTSAQEAIAAGSHDIVANSNRIIEEETEAELESWFKGTGKKLIWAVRHLDVDGNEFISEVEEHEAINPEEGEVKELKSLIEDLVGGDGEQTENFYMDDEEWAQTFAECQSRQMIETDDIEITVSQETWLALTKVVRRDR